MTHKVFTFVLVLMVIGLGYNQFSEATPEATPVAEPEVILASDTIEEEFTDSDVEGLNAPDSSKSVSPESMSFDFTGAFGGKLSQPLGTTTHPVTGLNN